MYHAKYVVPQLSQDICHATTYLKRTFQSDDNNSIGQGYFHRRIIIVSQMYVLKSAVDLDS